MANSTGSWALKFPVYQIDFSAAAAGKRVAATKRKIRWRFGFPNKKALDDGLTGTDCRGEEHEINVVWSLTSGKRQVTMDGKDVHYSSSRQGILDFSFTTRGNHVIKVICHAAPPMSATPGFRQYELLVDGQSFFTMPKMYELGVKASNPYTRVPGYTGANNYSNPTSPISMGSGMASGSQGRSYVPNDYSQPTSRQEEEAELQRAIQASIEESRRHLEQKGGDDGGTAYTAPQENADLLDFGAAPSAGTAPYGQSNGDARSVASYYSAPTTYNPQPPAYNGGAQYQSPPPQQVAPGALVPSHGPPGYYNATPPPSNQFATPPPVPTAQAPAPAFASAPAPAPMYAAAPAPVYAPAYAPAPAPAYASAPAYQPQGLLSTPNQPSNDVFGLNSPPEDDPFVPKAPPQPTYQDFASTILGAYTSPSSTGSAPQTPASGTSNGFAASPQANGEGPTNGNVPHMSMNALTNTEDEVPKNSFESALKKLVNVDRIDEPAEGEVRLTMMQKEEAKKKVKKGHSTPLPPVGVGVVGSNARLAEIKSVRPGGGTLKNDTEGKIMRAPPAGLFQQGAAHGGALVVHGQGPPPLQQPMGFGVGARLPNGGLQNQQQSPYHMQQQQQPQYR
mmetsp:Transcript_80181/g.120511  ORF Transcript_80181/g.120511 Transcript_80181/m.120511 type:complete len:620 (+) Transcript_80181:131-1990(+)|eukprot:CAMPEP_0117028800 /NCGR_PEP_ID=MMETSP0472-20121206/20913_1 /TAXON_ID=693140 ORGANISM="Tiarina fusus, Strain LIS" /NCGR_SAMPLE_ID=MMETSP0472 /ASSEMBLY_ACC=CAM_ASM_000603 /LENGTH=619 /DNA_ID=CAMNT_0004736397 /DNA_START=130 /DNA_END=1989 /DNA_ORIENTATION=-